MSGTASEENNKSQGSAGPTEHSPLVHETRTLLNAQRIITFFLCCGMICLSVLLININKFIMAPSRFPYSMALVMAQMVVGTILAGFLFMVKPSLFPALTDPDTKIKVDLRFMATMFLPIAIFFSLSLILSNAAYSYLGLAFIQMIKETNIVWVYFLSVMCRMEALSWKSIQIVIVSLVGMSLTIHGERYFTVAGFLIQLAAIILESLRVTLQGTLLQGKKFDPLSYVLIASPTCGILVLIISLLLMPWHHKSKGFAMPNWLEVAHWAPWLVLSGAVAFALNISIAAVIKRVGSMSYIICQLVKDVVAVLASVFLLGETIGKMQGTGFGLQLLCVLTWSMIKAQPEMFVNGIIPGLVKCIQSVLRPPDSAGPKPPILNKA